MLAQKNDLLQGWKDNSVPMEDKDGGLLKQLFLVYKKKVCRRVDMFIQLNYRI
jgi:hypothetical protein